MSIIEDPHTQQEKDQDEFVETLIETQVNPAVGLLENALEAARQRYETFLEASHQDNPPPRAEGEPRRPNIKAANAGMAFRSMVHRRQLREALDLIQPEPEEF